MNEDYFDPDRDTEADNRPELIKQTEDLYYALEHNLTHEAQNVISQIFNVINQSYDSSDKKRKWNMLLLALQDEIDNFENELSDGGEMKMYALYQETLTLAGKAKQEDKKPAEQRWFFLDRQLVWG